MKNQLPKKTAQVPSADVTTIETSISGVVTLVSGFVIGLLKDQKKKYPLAGPKKEGTMQVALQKAKDHPEILPNNWQITDFESYLYNRAVFLHLKNIIGDLYKQVDDTYVAYGILASNETNNVLGFFQMAVPDNPGLEDDLEEIDQFFVRGPRKAPISFNIPVSGSIDVNNCVPGTRVINKGNSRLSLSAGSELSGKIKRVPAMFVEPNSAVQIPVGYTSICITNLSATEAGSFTVKVRA